jgi:hypothetical protein
VSQGERPRILVNAVLARDSGFAVVAPIRFGAGGSHEA